MDHHCPWTANCVSARTFPHFLRFLFYAVLSMTILECHLWARCMVIWEKRSQPSYLGPSVYQLVHLLDLFVVNSLTLFALFVLLVSHCHSLLINQTMIEDWEIERHETLVWRAKKNGGYVYGPGGRKVWVRKQEFPFDIGFWNNAVQGMGTANLLAWFIPFAPSPSRESGWEYETNGFEIPGTSWPPPDPDRMPRNMSPSRRHRGTFSDHPNRQRRDQRRRVGLDGSDSPAEVPDEYDWLEGDDEDDNGHGYDEEVREEDDYKNVYDYDYVGDNGIDENSGGWMNSQGDRLRDYGVDEEAEVLTDEDDIPLGELIRRRKAKAQAAIETAATTVAE
jgi:palmitoyltransferase